MSFYQVIVSNVGTVYAGANAHTAESIYNEYKEKSRNAIGKAAGEDVTAMMNGEPYKEFTGAISEAHSAAQEADDSEGCGNCPACLLADALKKRNRIKSEQSAGVSYHDNYTDAVLALTLYNRSKGEGQSFSLTYEHHLYESYSADLDKIDAHPMYARMTEDTNTWQCAMEVALGGEAAGGTIHVYGSNNKEQEHHYFVVYQL